MDFKRIIKLKKMKSDIKSLTNFKIEKQITATAICRIKFLVLILQLSSKCSVITSNFQRYNN